MENPELAAGQYREVTAGVAGSVTTTTTTQVENSLALGEPVVAEDRVDPIARVIEIGTLQPDPVVCEPCAVSATGSGSTSQAAGDPPAGKPKNLLRTGAAPAYALTSIGDRKFVACGVR